MKPPPVKYDQRPMFWATGGIFGGVGLLLAFVDHPLVPLSHVFHLIPIGIGGAIGAALLRERYGPLATIAYVLLGIWLLYAVITNQTSGSILLLSSGVYSLTRAVAQTVEME